MNIALKKRRIPTVIELLDWIIACILVIAPVFQHYIGSFVNAGWTLWLVCAVLVLLRVGLTLSRKGSIEQNIAIAFLILATYYLYHLLDHGFNSGNVLTTLIILVIYFYIASKRLDFKALIRIARFIALANFVCLLVQYISYYLLHYNLQFVNLAKLVDQDYRWVKRLSSTSISLLFYRPSGLFLEPSHVFLFAFPVVLYYFSDTASTKTDKRLAWIILSEIVISTSSMGIVFAVGMLIAYFVMFYKPHYKRGSLFNFFTPRTIIILLFSVVLIWFLYIRFEVIQNMILRIFSTDVEGYNAIAGRTNKGIGLLSEMSSKQKLIGISDTMGDLGKSISGYQGEMYKYGIIGIAISYFYYFFCMIKSNQNFARYMAIVLVGISFVCAHTHRDFFMLYYSAFLFEGLRKSEIQC